MMLLNLLVFILVLGISESTLDPAGTKCGEKRCSTTEYCSLFDSQCLPCSSICDPTTHNHHLDLCVKDCQGKFSFLFKIQNKNFIYRIMYSIF